MVGAAPVRRWINAARNELQSRPVAIKRLGLGRQGSFMICMRGFTKLRYGAASAAPRRFLAFSNCTTAPARVTSAEANRAQWITKVEAFARHRPPVERSTRVLEAEDSLIAIGRLQKDKRAKGRVLPAVDFGLAEFLQALWQHPRL